jgi:hypothetical protein
MPSNRVPTLEEILTAIFVTASLLSGKATLEYGGHAVTQARRMAEDVLDTPQKDKDV